MLKSQHTKHCCKQIGNNGCVQVQHMTSDKGVWVAARDCSCFCDIHFALVSRTA